MSARLRELPPLSAEQLAETITAARSEHGSTHTDHLSLSPDVLYLSGLAEAATLARYIREDVPFARQARQAALVSLRFFQAAEASRAQGRYRGGDIRPTEDTGEDVEVPL